MSLPMFALGVDPGMSDPSGVVLVMERVGKLPEVVCMASLRAFPARTRVTKLTTCEQLAGAHAHALELLAVMGTLADQPGVLRFAVEGYVDAGKGMAAGRYLVPMLLGALYAAAASAYAPGTDRIDFHAVGHPARWWWQSPAVMGSYRGAVHLGRGEARTRALAAFDRQLCAGWSQLTTDHLRAAGAHALHALGRMRSERLHLAELPE